jgi:hypothetical protein
MPRSYPESITVPVTMPRNLHPAAERVRRMAAEQSARERSRAPYGNDPRRSVYEARVAKESVDRAVRILHALYVEAQRRSWQVVLPNASSSDSRSEHRTLICVGRESCAVRIVEVAKATKRPSRSTWSGREATVLVPMGLLRVELDEYLLKQRSWSDGPKMRVEDKLGAVLASIEEHCALSAERTTLRREDEAAAAVRREHAQIAQARSQALMAAMERWETAKRLLAFAEAARSANADPEWVAFAVERARNLDPLVNGSRLPPFNHDGRP